MAEKTPWYLKQSPLGAAYAHFSNVAGQKTVLDAKTKELIRLAVASVFRCKHCTEHHIAMPLKQALRSRKSLRRSFFPHFRPQERN